MRVYELAKQLGVGSKELVAKLHELGVEVKSHMSAVDEAAVALLTEAHPPPSPEPVVEEPEKETAPAPEPSPEPAAEQEVTNGRPMQPEDLRKILQHNSAAKDRAGFTASAAPSPS